MKLKLTNYQRMIFLKLVKSIGSDVPACIESKDLKMKGYGDKIIRNKMPYNFYFLIINPNIKVIY
jgi:4-diphosphocytidyl-2C-methyl-D-erythritol kinase